jgi:hypothetical protein
MKMKWTYQGDSNLLDYGGTFGAHIGARRFLFVRLENMPEVCGTEWDGSKYIVDLALVDLAELDLKTIAGALKSCGPDDTSELNDLWVAWCCYDYGAKAPLDSVSTNNGNRGIREMKQAAREYAWNVDSLEEKLDGDPVNKIGSTAREFMTGDINSAILRGLAVGNNDAELMAKIGMLR